MEDKIRKKYGRLAPFLDEKLRRLMAASEAWALGYGGIALVSRATGLSIPAIRTGLAELEDPDTIIGDRIRRPGAGRKPLCDRQVAVLVSESLTRASFLVQVR